MFSLSVVYLVILFAFLNLLNVVYFLIWCFFDLLTCWLADLLTRDLLTRDLLVCWFVELFTCWLFIVEFILCWIVDWLSYRVVGCRCWFLTCRLLTCGLVGLWICLPVFLVLAVYFIINLIYFSVQLEHSQQWFNFILTLNLQLKWRKSHSAVVNSTLYFTFTIPVVKLQPS
jgi:hypothetical protein